MFPITRVGTRKRTMQLPAKASTSIIDNTLPSSQRSAGPPPPPHRPIPKSLTPLTPWERVHTVRFLLRSLRFVHNGTLFKSIRREIDSCNRFSTVLPCLIIFSISIFSTTPVYNQVLYKRYAIETTIYFKEACLRTSSISNIRYYKF